MLHLKHRNIIQMRDFYTSNNQLCIVMDFADGGDLRGEIVRARNSNVSISEEVISTWIIQVDEIMENLFPYVCVAHLLYEINTGLFGFGLSSFRTADSQGCKAIQYFLNVR